MGPKFFESFSTCLNNFCRIFKVKIEGWLNTRCSRLFTSTVKQSLINFFINNLHNFTTLFDSLYLKIQVLHFLGPSLLGHRVFGSQFFISHRCSRSLKYHGFFQILFWFYILSLLLPAYGLLGPVLSRSQVFLDQGVFVSKVFVSKA